MELLQQLLDFILHVDAYLELFIQNYGHWVYALLFLIVFVETGVVVMPLLPGDSLLFVVGIMCGSGLLDYGWSVTFLLAAAILGNQINYAVGRLVGVKVFKWTHADWLIKLTVDEAHTFFETYGGATVVAARFLPFFRTFVPFYAGMGQMAAVRFFLFNVLGGILWVVGIVSVGCFFGNIPWVNEHITHVIWAMVLIPVLWMLAKAKLLRG